MPNFNPLKDGFELPSKFVKESIKKFSETYKYKKIITYIHNYQKGKYLELLVLKKIKKLFIVKILKGGVIDLID